MQSDCFPKNYSLKYKKKFHEKRNRNRIASNNFPFDTTQVHKTEVKSRENAKWQHRSSKISMHILHSFFKKMPGHSVIPRLSGRIYHVHRRLGRHEPQRRR